MIGRGKTTSEQMTPGVPGGGGRTLAKNAALNVIRQVCTIVFPLVSFVYSTRILGAANIGVFTFSQSIIKYFILIAGLGVSTYAVREGSFVRDDPEQLNRFANQVFSINIVTTVLSYVLLFLLMATWGKLADYEVNILMQSTAIALSTLGADWVNSIFEDFTYLTVRYVGIQVVCLVCLFLFVRSRGDLVPYTVITVMAAHGGNILNWVYIRKYVRIRPTLHMDLKRHLAPILVLFGNVVAVTIYVASDVTILGIFRPDDQVGVYSVSVKVYTLVKELLNAITMVTVPRLSYLLAKNDRAKYDGLCSDVVGALVLLIFPFIVGVYFQGGNLLLLFAGEEYLEGVATLRVLCLALFFAVGGCFLLNSVLVPNKQEKVVLAATLCAAAVNVGLNIVVIPYWGMVGAALTTVVAEGVNFVISAVWARKYVRLTLPARDAVTIAVGTVGVFLACKIVDLLGLSPLPSIAGAVALSIVVYLAVTVVGGNGTVRRLLTARRPRG